MTVENYITGKIKTSGWNFVSFTEITNKFGEKESRYQLNELFKAGKIVKREGGNFELIEWIGQK